MAKVKVAGVSKLEIEIALTVSAIVTAIFLYFAYSRSFFPFTADNKAKLHSLLFGAPKTPAATAPPIQMYLCTDSSQPNPVTGKCLNGQPPVLTNVAAPPAGAPGTVSNQGQEVRTPEGGTGAVSLQNAQAVANPYALYCSDGTVPDPTTQLCDDGSTPGAKPDQSVNQIFQQEMYKQLFLPYQKYPYLYGPNYTQALMPRYANRCIDGSSPSATSGLCADGSMPVPNPGDIQNLSSNPYATVFGTIPPIQGGDIPPQTQQQQALQYYQQQQLQQTYGLFPPGGYTPNPQTTAPLPGTPSTDNTGLGSICFTDNTGVQWCPSPNTPPNTAGCTTINGVVYCNTASAANPVSSPGNVPQGCFTVGNQTYCLMQGGDPSNPPANCVTDGTNVYCPSGTSVPTNPGGTNPSAGQCFQLGGITYCQSQADPSTPGCTVVNGITYCPIQSGGSSPTPPTTVPGTPSDGGTGTGTAGCFTAADGTSYCPCTTPVTGSVQAGGQLFCPQGAGGAGCFTTSDGTDYCPCTTATSGAIYANNQLYCVKAPATPPPTGTPTTPGPPTGGGATPTCPPGYNYDSTHDVCVQTPSTGQPSCGVGEVWDPTIGICHIQCSAGFFFDPSLDTCRGSCPAGTSWDPTRAACVQPQPPPVTTPPPPPQPQCPSGYEMSSTGNCVNCGTGHDQCCGSYHNGNCHGECCHGSCMTSSSCRQCLSVCGTYEGQCNCSTHQARYAQARYTHRRAMKAQTASAKKSAYPAIAALAAEKRALARAAATNINLPPFTPSAVSMRNLPRGGSWRIARS